MDFSRLLSRKRTPPVSPSVEEMLHPLDDPFRRALLSMYNGEAQIGSDGKSYEIDSATRISPRQGMWIYQLCCELRPQATLEIGIGYGFSTIFFLAALAKNAKGHHSAVDPFQQEWWQGVGLQKVREVGMQGSFQFISENSVRAATDLRRTGRKFDLIFIDGNHRFDDVLMDFSLCALLSKAGGYIVLDDMFMPSVQTVVSFIRANRSDFAELSTPIPNIAAFRMIGDGTRDWDHFTPFTVAAKSRGN